MRQTMMCLIVVLFFSSCAQMGPYMVSSDVYKSSRGVAVASNKGNKAIIKARVGEDVAYSKSFIGQQNILHIYHQKMQEAAKAGDDNEVLRLQGVIGQIQQFQFNSGTGYGGNFVAGRPARMVSLQVINSSKNYIVQFTEEPLRSQVGQLGPGQVSEHKIRLPEGRYTLRYIEVRIGREYHGRQGRERNVDLFIDRNKTKIDIE